MTNKYHLALSSRFSAALRGVIDGFYPAHLLATARAAYPSQIARILERRWLSSLCAIQFEKHRIIKVQFF